MEHLTQNSLPSFYTFEGNFIFFGVVVVPEYDDRLRA